MAYSRLAALDAARRLGLRHRDWAFVSSSDPEGRRKLLGWRPSPEQVLLVGDWWDGDYASEVAGELRMRGVEWRDCERV